MALSDIKMESVVSSNLAEVGYDEETKILRIAFRSGAVYDYRNVPRRVYDDLLTADSVGQYFHQNIRNDYAFTKI